LIRRFGAGGDLAPGAGGAPFTVNRPIRANFIVRLLSRIEACTLPLVARVNGPAIAGVGADVACDMAVAFQHGQVRTPRAM